MEQVKSPIYLEIVKFFFDFDSDYCKRTGQQPINNRHFEITFKNEFCVCFYYSIIGREAITILTEHINKQEEFSFSILNEGPSMCLVIATTEELDRIRESLL
jgi:hypothetical protein